ncbi:Nuclear transport factor 2 [Cladochytrium tenue]|nr:Nuclear transport factor 2 [Cladochytrium tenue]
MTDITAVAKQFTEYYYSVFDTNRAQLLPLYVRIVAVRDYSMMIYESKQVAGAQAIVQHLMGLQFQAIKHIVTTCDAQPSHPTQGSILITVMGQLKCDDDPPMNFLQIFNLYPEGPGQYFVYNGAF